MNMKDALSKAKDALDPEKNPNADALMSALQKVSRGRSLGIDVVRESIDRLTKPDVVIAPKDEVKE